MKITESQFNKVLDAYKEADTHIEGVDEMRAAIESLGIEVIPDPETITINGVEVPAPEHTELAEGTCYYIADTSQENGLDTWVWNDDDESDKDWLQRGLVYLKKKDAKAVVEAMMKPLTKYMEKNRENP